MKGLSVFEALQIPIGMKTIVKAVTDEITEVVLQDPWMAYTITNSGPNSVFMSMNEKSGLRDEDGILINETLNIDMKFPMINALFFRCASGETATVRLRGKVGRRTG